MNAILLAATLAATPSPLKLAVPGFDFIQMDQKKGDFFAEYLAQQLGQQGFQVVTAKQIGAVIGLERQKQLLGCTDASQSCIAELAGALGAEALVVGSIAHFEGEYTFALRIVSAQDASVLAQSSGRVSGDRKALDWLAATAIALAEPTKKALGRSAAQPATRAADSTGTVDVTAAPASGSGGVRRFAWIPALLAASSAGVATVFTIDAQNKANQLRMPGLGSSAAAADVAQQGKNAQTTAVVLFVASGVIAAGAVGMFALGGDSGPPAQIGALVTPGGAAVSLSGRFE